MINDPADRKSNAEQMEAHKLAVLGLIWLWTDCRTCEDSWLMVFRPGTSIQEVACPTCRSKDIFPVEVKYVG